MTHRRTNYVAAIRQSMLPCPITLRTAGVMTTAELANWALISRNAVPSLVCRFGIPELAGNVKNRRYSAHKVLKSILGITPKTPQDLERLLIPLQKACWVAQITGMSVSAINAAACEKRNFLPLPFELTVTGPDQAPARGRRWIPAQIEAHLRGDPIPFLVPQTKTRKAPSKGVTDPACNVFAAICDG